MSTLADNLQHLANIKQSIKEAIRYQQQPVLDSDSFDSYAEKIANINDLDLELQSKSLTVTENGTQTITPDTGYNGLSSVEITTNVQPDGAVVKSIPATAYKSYTSNVYCAAFIRAVKKIDNLDLSGFTDFSYGFSFNNNTAAFMFVNLEEINFSNTSGVTTFEAAFHRLPALKKITGIDTSNCTNLRIAFANCSLLTFLPFLDVSKVTNMQDPFRGTALEEINFNETLALTSMNSGVFLYCRALKRINGIFNVNRVSTLSQITNMFGSATDFSDRPTLLEEVRIKCLKADLDLSFAPNLSHDSLVYIIDNANTVSGKTLTLGATNLAKLTAEEIAVGTAKGWTIA